MAIARVQVTIGGADGGQSFAISTANFGASCTSGNQILVLIRNGDTGGGAAVVTGVADTLGTTPYSALASDASRDPAMFAYLGTLTSSGTNAITVTFNAATFYPWILAIELSGVATSSQVDEAFATLGTGVTDCVSSAFSTDTAAEYVSVAISQNNLASYTAGTDFTLVDGLIPTNPSDFGGVEEYIPAGTLSSYVAHITSDITGNYTMLTVALRPAGGGGGTTYPGYQSPFGWS